MQSHGQNCCSCPSFFSWEGVWSQLASQGQAVFESGETWKWGELGMERAGNQSNGRGERCQAWLPAGMGAVRGELPALGQCPVVPCATWALHMQLSALLMGSRRLAGNAMSCSLDVPCPALLSPYRLNLGQGKVTKAQVPMRTWAEQESTISLTFLHSKGPVSAQAFAQSVFQDLA